MSTLWQAYAQSGDATLVKVCRWLAYQVFWWWTSSQFQPCWTHEMMKAKFDYLVSQQTYRSLSPEQEQIISLTAQLKQVSNKMLHLSKQMTEQAKARANAGNGQQGSSSSKGRQGKTMILKNWNERSNKRAQRKDEKWKKIPPKEGEPNKKKWEKWNGHGVVSTWHGHSIPWLNAELRKQEKSTKTRIRKTW